ncbi:cilia- and flagella-associated protein 61-like [Apis florea]|uniref:cilia- and flagella-associated protein 61-like n=1 Tax=Apis florea TaxID=7463 RepID=UPI0012FEB732|nr:cilia- and flagella-associated protein 61-like [Apis florea]
MVQWNEKGEIVSGICISNYPNVPSVIPEDWMNWLYTLYRVQQVTEKNSMFVHVLVWDARYTGHFFEKLLSGLFDVTSYLEYILIVIPPRIILTDVFEHQMIKIPLNSGNDHPSYQSIFMSDRFLKKPRLKIRRVVEEDNDDVVSIIDAETPLLKEFYGEFYVSEMVRNPDNCRKLIISEEDDTATGVMFINKNIDVETLIDNFQLVPYNGLKKPHKKDVLPEEYTRPDSETFFSFFTKKLDIDSERSSVIISPEESTEEVTEELDDQLLEVKKFEEVDPSMMTFITDLPRITRHFSMYYESKVESSAFVESLFHIPRRTIVTSITDEIRLETIYTPEQPVYYGKVNAFVLEIFAMKQKMKLRESRNFIEAAFESFPDLEYCVILLPSNHVFIPLLHHFVRVAPKCNKDYPMSLYLTHRAALLGQITLRAGKSIDKLILKRFLKRILKSDYVLHDFDKATNKNQRSDMYSYIFKWNDTIIGVIIIRVEKETTYIKRRYHIEDYVAIQNIPLNGYARILHFIIMPIFSIHIPFLISEISRLSGFFVFYYRLEESSLSALTRTHPLAICLTVMIPVYPRRRIKYRYRNLIETDRKPKEETESFSLFLTTPRLSMMLGNIVDSKIVVVGASDCGVAFVEQLALGCNFIRFANLTLISPNGLPYDNNYGDLCDRMIPFTGRYCRKYRKELPTRVWINIVYGTVTTINRKEKYVTVFGQGNITYDYLILTCGMQYQKPKFQEELELEKNGQFFDIEVPWNMLTINDDTEAAVCLEKIKKLTENLKKKS